MSNVLVVVGSRERAEFAKRALTHPQIHVEAADKEDQIVAALTGQRFDLAIVGGKIGQRGPLILCEAVRLRQEVPVLVLVGEETSEQALSEHKKQGRADVHYIDMRNVNGGMTALTQALAVLRNQALEILAVPEDPDAATRWTQALEQGAGEPVKTDDILSSGDDFEILEADADAPPPTVAQLTEEDIDFASRMVDKVRGTDFRKPIQPLRLDGVDAAERKTVMLRERVRELERALARLAFVYAARKTQFDGAADNAARFDGDRVAMETRLRELEGIRGQLEARLQALGGDRAQIDARLAALTTQLQQEQQLRVEKERGFGSMLQQAQDAFGMLREQSTKAIAQFEEQLKRRNEDLARLTDALNRATAENDRLKESQQKGTAERETLVGQQAALTAEAGQLRGELKAHQEEVARLRDHKTQATEQLRTLREQLEHGATVHQQALERAKQDFAEAEKAWLDKLAKLKSTAATFRDAFEEREGQLADKDKSIAQLSAELGEAQKELQQLHDTHKTLAKVIESERDTSSLDKRLSSIEEQEAHSSKRIARQLDLLEEIKQALHKHESVLDKINEGLVRRVEAELANSKISVPMQTWLWMIARPSRLAIAAGAVALLLVAGAAVGLVVGVPSGAPAAAAVQSAAEPDHEAEQAAAPMPGPAPAPVDTAPAAPGGAEEPRKAGADTDSAPSPTAAPKEGGSEEERKALRKKMLAAFGKKSFHEAVKIGLELQSRYDLDWEAQFKLAEAMRKSGRMPQAIEMYRAFAADNPGNAFEDDALFYAASLLAKAGNNAEARPLFEKVASDPKSTFAADAKKMLAKK